MSDETLLIPAETRGVESIRWDEGRAAAGDSAIALSVADMDFKAPAAVVSAVTQRAAMGNYCYTYWTDDYYDAVTAWFASRHQWNIDRQAIVPVGRMVESLPAILREVVGEGARVVVPYPAYSPTPQAIKAANCHVVLWLLDLHDGVYSMDMDKLRELLRDAQALVITNPHNPTGRVWTQDELAAVAHVADEFGTLVISDEFHADLVHSGHRFHPYLLSAGDTKRAISFTSPGKTFNMAGLETGNIIVPDESLRQKVRKAIDDAGCHNPRFFAQAATVAGYRHSGAWLDELLALVSQHVALLREATASIDGVDLIEPEGTYLAWLDFRASGLDDEQLESRLLSHGLVLTPGIEFGEGGSGFMRINLAVPTAELTEALRRVAAAMH